MDTSTLITAVIAVFTYLVWRVYRRIEWLTGALESHSVLFLRLEAARSVSETGQPVKVVWWDPDIDQVPVRPEHKKETKVTEIYLYLPPRLRRNRQSRLRRVWYWLIAA
jgi:hypothetical protein